MTPPARGRLVPVWLWLAALAVCAVLAARATYTADMSAFLPRAPTAEQRLLVDQLREGLVSRLILVGIEGGDATGRAAASRAVAKALRSDPNFVAVANGESASLERDQAFFFEHRYQLSPAVEPARFTVDGLRAAIQDTLDLLASPAGLLAKAMVPRDPTGEIALLIERAGAQSATARNRPATAEGVWASRDGKRAVLLLQTKASGGDTDAQQQAIGAVRAAFAAAQPGAMELRMTGPGVFGVQARERIEREVTKLSILGTGAIVLLLLLLYRSFTALALGLVPVATGVLVAVAAVSLGFGTVHGLTLGFGTTLIGEAVDYSIYLFVQSRHPGASREAWVRSFWPTVRLGVLTSVLGFAALLFSGFPGLAQLGLYSIAGLTAAALVTRFVLPVLLPAGFAVRDISGPGAMLARLVDRAALLRWPAIALLVVAAAIVFMKRETLWSAELAALSPVSQADQNLDQALRADLGAPDVRYLVVVSAPTQEAALSGAERVDAALQPLVRENAIGGIDSPSHMLPSMQTQQRRLDALPPREELATRLREALRELPLKAERLEPFLDDAERARTRAPVQRDALQGTTIGVALDGMLARQPAAEGAAESWTALLPLHAPRTEGAAATAAAMDPQRIRAALPAAAGGSTILFVDLKREADALYGGYLHEAVLLSLAGLAAIALLIAIALRSVVRMLGVMAPLGGTLLLVTAGLALAGEALSILHLVGLLLVIAVGSNYALFFAAPGEAHGGDLRISPRTLTSLLFANVAAVCGFGILALSGVPVLHAIGITVGPGAVLALVLAAVFARRRAPEGHGASDAH